MPKTKRCFLDSKTNRKPNDVRGIFFQSELKAIRQAEVPKRARLVEHYTVLKL